MNPIHSRRHPFCPEQYNNQWDLTALGLSLWAMLVSRPALPPHSNRLQPYVPLFPLILKWQCKSSPCPAPGLLSGACNIPRSSVFQTFHPDVWLSLGVVQACVSYICIHTCTCTYLYLYRNYFIACLLVYLQTGVQGSGHNFSLGNTKDQLTAHSFEL